MVVINSLSLLANNPIKSMVREKMSAGGTSYGLTECGYDIRIKQEVLFRGRKYSGQPSYIIDGEDKLGTLCLASAIEEFDMPTTLMGQILNKSTWARKGLDASRTTNIEPGWKGFLTLELVCDSWEDLFIPAGSGIAQVIFHELAWPARYSGKYQNQADQPVEAILDNKS